MAAVIIRKKDVERLGKELLKEIFEFLHDEYILSNFEDMKLQKQNFLKSLVLIKFRRVNYTVKQKGNSWAIEYEKFDESKYEEELKLIKDEIKNECFDISLVFDVLNRVELDGEIAGYLFYKKRSIFKYL